MLKKCITSISCSGKLDEFILDRIFCDSSIHNTLFQIVCTTPQALEVGYLVPCDLIWLLAATILFYLLIGTFFFSVETMFQPSY